MTLVTLLLTTTTTATARPATAELEIAAPPGLHVDLDGQEIGVTPMTRTVTAGTHVLVVYDDTGHGHRAAVTLVGGEHHRHDVPVEAPAPPAVEPPRLLVTAPSKGTVFRVDHGDPLTTPAIVELEPGEHEVEVLADDGQVVFTRTIRALVGQAELVDLDAR